MFDDFHHHLSKILQIENSQEKLDMLFSSLGELLRVSNLCSYILYRNKPPLLFYYEGDYDKDALFSYYLSGGYLLDPFYQGFVTKRFKSGIYTLKNITSDKSNEYHHLVLEKLGLIDEVNLFQIIDEQTAIVVSIGRNQSQKKFGNLFFQQIQSVYPIIVTILSQSWQTHQKHVLSFTEIKEKKFHQKLTSALSHFGESILTKREKQILDCILSGYSIKHTSEQLSITTGTVRLHRSNIYKKLGVNSQTELFYILLKSLPFADRYEDPLHAMLPEQSTTK